MVKIMNLYFHPSYTSITNESARKLLKSKCGIISLLGSFTGSRLLGAQEMFYIASVKVH